MAGKKKPAENVVTMNLKGSVTNGHPLWGGSGRPILIGDTCRHKELGRCVVRGIAETGHMVNVRVLSQDVNRLVHVNELEREFEALQTLLDAEGWT